MYIERNFFWETIEGGVNSLWITNERNRPNREDLEIVEALWELREFSRVEGASEDHCLCPSPPWQGGGPYSGALAYLQDHSSIFQPHCSEPISALTKGSKQDQLVSPHAPGLLAQRFSSPTSQCPRLCGLLSGSNQPARNTQHTQPSRKLLPFKATFFKTRRELFCLIHIIKLRKPDKMKRQKHLSNEGRKIPRKNILSQQR